MHMLHNQMAVENQIEVESLIRIAKAMLDDAKRVVIHGTPDELQELEQWLNTSNYGWDFETTCHIVHLDDVLERNRITKLIAIRKQIEGNK